MNTGSEEEEDSRQQAVMHSLLVYLHDDDSSRCFQLQLGGCKTRKLLHRRRHRHPLRYLAAGCESARVLSSSAPSTPANHGAICIITAP